MNKFLIGLMFGAIIFGLGGYYSVKNQYDNKEEKVIEKTVYPYQLQNRQNTQILNETSITTETLVQVRVSKTGDAYLIVDPNGNGKEPYKGQIETLNKDAKEYDVDGVKMTAIKLDVTDALYGIYTLVGQGDGSSFILFIKKDGTISALNYGALVYNGKIEISNNVGNLNEVVNIFHTTGNNGIGAFAVNKDGNETLLTNILQNIIDNGNKEQ